MRSDVKIDNKHEFIPYKQIQSTINTAHVNNGNKLSIKEAIQMLKIKNISQTTTPEIPDFAKWDINNSESFKKIINEYPVDIKLLFNKIFNESSFLNFEVIDEKKDIIFINRFNNCPLEMMSHNFYEIYYVLSGSCNILINKEKFTLMENEFFFAAPYVPHCPEVEDGNILLSFFIRASNFEKTFFNLLIQNNLLSDFFKETLHKNIKRINYLRFQIENPTEIKTFLRLLLIEYHKSKTYSNEICINLMNIIFSIILRDYEKRVNALDINKINIHENFDFSLILKYIEENYSTINIKKLADVFNYDKAYLGKIIKKNTGYNFPELINCIRLKNACLLLQNKNFKISDVSEIVGFHSSDYFSKLFKKTYGCTPKNYIRTI